MRSFQSWWDGLSEAGRIAIIAAVIAFFGAFLAAIINAAFNRSAAKASRRPLGSSLEIVDVVVIQDAGIAPMMLQDSTTLDIKVRNKGDQVAFVKSAVLHVSESEMIEFWFPASAVPISATYDVALPARPPSKPFTVTHHLSQEVKANDLDRFAIRLATKGHPGKPGYVICRLTLEIRYNAGAKQSVRTGPIIVLLPLPYMIKGLTFFGGFEDGDEEYLASVRGSLTAMLRILHLEGQRSSALERMEQEIRNALDHLPS